MNFSSFSFVALLMASSVSGVGYAQSALPAPEAFVSAKAVANSHKAKKVVKKELKATKKEARYHKTVSLPAASSRLKVSPKLVIKPAKVAVVAKKQIKIAPKLVKKEAHKEIHQNKKLVKKSTIVVSKKVLPKEPQKVLHTKSVPVIKKTLVSKVTVAGAAAVAGGVATATAVVHHNAATAAEVAKKTIPEPASVDTSSKNIEDDRPIVEQQPTYAFLKTRMVNMRRGPGEEYPIDWVYSRRGLPVKVLVRYRMWRKVIDPYGTTGWMKLITLHMGRHFVVTGQKTDEAMPDQKHLNQVGGSPLIQVWVDPKANPAGDEVIMYKSAYSRKRVAYLKPGVVGQILRCKASSKFCDVKVDSYSGSILKSHIWGIEKDEDFEAVKPSFFR